MDFFKLSSFSVKIGGEDNWSKFLNVKFKLRTSVGLPIFKKEKKHE